MNRRGEWAASIPCVPVFGRMVPRPRIRCRLFAPATRVGNHRSRSSPGLPDRGCVVGSASTTAPGTLAGRPKRPAIRLSASCGFGFGHDAFAERLDLKALRWRSLRNGAERTTTLFTRPDLYPLQRLATDRTHCMAGACGGSYSAAIPMRAALPAGEGLDTRSAVSAAGVPGDSGQDLTNCQTDNKR